MEMIGKTPQELDRMTLSEIAVAAINIDEEMHGRQMSQIEINAYFRWWNSLTPEQRLFAEND